ncbi:UNVERIFIED_CONTAM: Mettl17 [Trichonephila clavipes]
MFKSSCKIACVYSLLSLVCICLIKQHLLSSRLNATNFLIFLLQVLPSLLDDVQIYGHFECLAYMAARMPANYASIFKIFSEIKFQLPEYEPKTFFDFGSGVGSAVW